MSHRLALIIYFNIILFPLVSAQGVIAGRVTDKASNDPLPGVYVIYGKGLGTVTGSDGTYRLTADTGIVSLRFQFIGFRTSVKEVTIRQGETVEVNISLETETHSIDQVIVSADRTEQKLSEMTVSVDVIKSDFLSRNHITEAQELITKTPGIEVLDGQASIRGGSGFSYGVGSRVLALVDGLPLLTADAGAIRWQYLPVENLSQVEITKGASSVLYGSAALDGVISFRTADATNIPSTTIFSETDFYLKPQNKDWVWWSSPRLFSSLSFSHLRKEGNTNLGLSMNLFTDNSYRKYNDEKLGKLSLHLKHFDKKINGLNYGINLNAGLTSKTDFILWESAEKALVQDTSTVAYLNGTYLAADPFISYGRVGRFRHDLKMRIQYSENKFPVKARNNARTFSFYSEYQLWYRITELLSITAGGSATWNKINSNFFEDHQSANIALFQQVEYRPVSKLKVIAGVRVEENFLDSKTDKIVPVFRTGINFQAAEYTYLRASIGQGYRFPSIAEKFASTTLGTVTIFPNPAVEPESGYSAEAGVKQGIKLGMITGQADLSVFFSQHRNMIEYVFGIYPDGLGFQANNVEQARIYGTEFQFLLNRTYGKLNTTLSGGYTFIYPVEYNTYTNKNSDTWLKYRRKHDAKLSIGASWKKLETDITLYARSKILNIDEVFLSPATREQILPGFYDYWLNHNTGYFLMDIGIGYMMNKWLTASVAMKNVSNTEYMGRPGDIQPPRIMCIRLTGKI